MYRLPHASPLECANKRGTKEQTKQTPWHESPNELYRPSDRRLSAKLVPSFAVRGVSRSQRGGSPATFSSRQLLICTHEAKWTPFQTHYLSESPVAPGIEPGPLDM
jgi:hypothetical protein